MRTALIVIDVQESFRQRENWTVVSQPDIVGQIDQLVAAERARGGLVVWVLHSEPGTGTVFDPERGFNRLIEGLAALPGEPVLVKTAHNAFTTTNLHQTLTSRGITAITVCGLRTEQCVETTARIGSDLGFAVTFVTDATATFPIPHWELPADASLAELLADPRTLPAGDVVTRTEYALAGRFAAVTTVKEWISG